MERTSASSLVLAAAFVSLFAPSQARAQAAAQTTIASIVPSV
jgi:hypothetical protein